MKSENITGVQHIGIPTNDMEKTLEFYHALGFETAFETINEEAGEKVVFLRCKNLVVEAYENHQAVGKDGAVDHIALDVLGSKHTDRMNTNIRFGHRRGVFLGENAGI